tara:strand:+ start:19507 stop:21036 length:1530 start_codon:yes stop_codon:yes gene_type:complete
MKDHEPQKNKLSFLTNVNYQILMVIVQRLSGLLLNVLLVKFLAPQSFGIFALFQRLAETTTSVYRIGLPASSQVLIASPIDKSIKNYDQGSLIGSALTLNFIIIVLGTFFLLFFKDFASEQIYQQPSIKPWILCLIIFCLFQALENTIDGILKGFNRFKKLGLFNSYIAFPYLILVPIFTWLFSLKGAIYIITFFQVVRTVFYAIFMLSELKIVDIKMNFKEFYSSAIDHLKIALPFYLPYLILAPVTIYLLSLLTDQDGLESMAYLKILVSIGTIIFAIPNAIVAVFLTRFAEEEDYSEDKKDLNRLFALNLKLVWLFSIISSLILVSVLPIIISILFGDEYKSILEMIPYYLPTITLLNMFNIFSYAFLARKNANSVMLMHVVFGIAWYFLGIYLIPSLGLTGYLISEVFSYFLAVVAAIMSYHFFFKPSIGFYESLTKIFLAMLAIFILAFYFNGVGEIIYRVLIFGSSCLVLLVLFWFLFLDSREKGSIYSVSLGFIKKLKFSDK